MERGKKGIASDIIWISFGVHVDVNLVTDGDCRETNPRAIMYASRDIIDPTTRSMVGIRDGMYQWDECALVSGATTRAVKTRQHPDTDAIGVFSIEEHVRMAIRPIASVNALTAICVQVACNMSSLESTSMTQVVHQCGWCMFSVGWLYSVMVDKLRHLSDDDDDGVFVEFTEKLHDCGDAPDGSRGEVRVCFDKTEMETFVRVAANNQVTRRTSICHIGNHNLHIKSHIECVTQEARRYINNGATLDDVWLGYVSNGAHTEQPAEGFIMFRPLDKTTQAMNTQRITECLAVVLHNRYRFTEPGMRVPELIQSFVGSVLQSQRRPDGIQMTPNELGAILMDVAMSMARTIRYTVDTGMFVSSGMYRVGYATRPRARIRECDEWNTNAEWIGCGDCEDVARMACEVMMIILYGKWETPELRALQLVRTRYVATLTLASFPVDPNSPAPKGFPIAALSMRVIHARCDLIPVTSFCHMVCRGTSTVTTPSTVATQLDINGSPRTSLLDDQDNATLATITGEGTGYVHLFLPPTDPRNERLPARHKVVAFFQAKGLVNVTSVLGVDPTCTGASHPTQPYYHWAHDLLVCDTQHWDPTTDHLSWSFSHFGVITLPSTSTTPTLGAIDSDYIVHKPNIALHQWPALSPATLTTMAEIDTLSLQWDHLAGKLPAAIVENAIAKYNERASIISKLNKSLPPFAASGGKPQHRMTIAADAMASNLGFLQDQAVFTINPHLSVQVTSIISYMIAPSRTVLFVDLVILT